MGDYSVVCAVSGLPITHRQKVVAFEVEPYRWDATKHRYAPKTWPVIGEYDYVGGIKGVEFETTDIAMIHHDIWEDAESYWHCENMKNGPVFFDFKRAIEEANAKASLDARCNSKEKYNYKYTMNDYLYYYLHRQFTDTDEGLVLREMVEAKNDNVTNAPKELCFLARGKFMERMLDKIWAGWTEEDSLTLYRLVCIYSGQTITGRHIAPCNQPYIEQYPSYKQRIKLLQKHYQLAKKLQKELNR